MLIPPLKLEIWNHEKSENESELFHISDVCHRSNKSAAGEWICRVFRPPNRFQSTSVTCKFWQEEGRLMIETVQIDHPAVGLNLVSFSNHHSSLSLFHLTYAPRHQRLVCESTDNTPQGHVSRPALANDAWHLQEQSGFPTEWFVTWSRLSYKLVS